MKQQKKQKQQKGFSLIELSLVIAVIAILTVGINLAYNAITDNLALNRTVETLEFTFLSAAQSCLNQAGDLTAALCTATVIQSVSKLENTATPYGDAWSVSNAGADATTLTIVYPFTSYGDSAGVEATALVLRLATKLSKVNGVTATANGVVLTVSYIP